MSLIVDRTCRELRKAEGPVGGMAWGEPESFSAFRSRRAYVLLGDPGAGKTTEFRREQGVVGDGLAVVVSARDLKTFDVDARPNWHNKILFIDGLDETRAGETDSRTPLDKIRAQLARLGTPSFRLSCREADWLGSNDRRHLEAVSPDSEITVLRLDPLDNNSTAELLRSQHEVEDTGEFVRKAHLYGVSAMLGNPLTLRLLADVVKQGGDWPRSRSEVLEKASRHLAGEHNDEHRVVRRGLPETVVDAAGYLCSVLLLAGMEGLSLSAGHFGRDVVCLDDLGDPPDPLTRQALEHALSTKLFTGDRAAAAEGVFTPLHRQVAEYLGGRYLARRIEGGLPARRVVALMTAPSDARVVSGLRGLSAWLAACSRDARRHLIAADPVGVGLYGDIGRFDLAEKKRLLEALPMSLVLGEAHWDDTAWAFRSLASAELVPAISEVLGRLRGRTVDDRSASLILGVLEHCEDPGAVAQLAPDLMAVVRADAVPAFLRRRALDAYLRISFERDDRELTLEGLVDAIHDRSISDPDDDLRGTLLGEFYPAVVGPPEVWDHLMFRNRDDYLGRLWAFKKKTLLERSDDQNLAELLDGLHARADELVPALIASRSGDLPLLLLEKALVTQGEKLDPQRLLGWLATARRAAMYSTRGSAAGIRSWLEERPQIQKAVYLASIRHSGDDDRTGASPFWYIDALHGSRLPSDFGHWCLDQAVALADTEPGPAQELLSRAYASQADPATGEILTVEVMQRETLGHPVLARRLEELLRPPRPPRREDEFLQEIEEQWQREEDERSRQHDAQREEWVQYLQDNETDLRENRFPPPDLHTLAKTYLGMFVDDDEDAAPLRRVRDFVSGDRQLAAAVLAALRGAMLHDDVPSVDETILLHSQSQHSWMAYPVLASVHLIDLEDPAQLDALDEERKRRLLAIYYCVPRPDKYGRGWHRRWIQQNPALVLDVLCRCALSGVRAGERFPPGMDDLDAIAGHEDLVHEVRLKLLKAYPTRSSNKQLELLDNLLAKALDHPDKTELLALACRKQALKSMGVAQRVRWSVADALIAQGSRLRQLKPNLVESEIRVRHLAQFLRSVWNRHDRRPSILTAVTDPITLRELIEILGHWCAAPFFRSGTYTLKMHTSDLIVDLIAQLGSAVSDEARQALECLIEDPNLAGWHDQLAGAYERQSVARRDASYCHPSVDQVQSTLAGGGPSNAAELAALMSGQLEELALKLRGDNSNVWSQFWNQDPHGRPIDPKPENACRDALVAALGERVPTEVDLEPEASYASDWQADIRARCGDFNIPIEIKRDRHRDLWRALRSQLIGQYTTDPATSGFGVYLVLWFGDGRVQTPPDGHRPRTPEELEQRLVQDLTHDEKRKISVIVMDVSKPSRPSRPVSPPAGA